MKNILTFFMLLFFICGCKEKFTTRIPSPATGYLVVEGFINSGVDPTTITLSRSVKLYDDVNFISENNAVVNIESETNEIFPLSELVNGTYISGSLSLDKTKKYRLQIRTQDNKDYVSDFASVQYTPDIDSVNWVRGNDGVKLFVNTHDPLNNTKYYKWDYEETWEFKAPYYSSLVYLYDATGTPFKVDFKNPYHTVDTTVHTCWNTNNSTNINIGSSEKLSEDVIHLPLVNIEPASVKLSVLYSMNVRQYALSRQAYSFYQKIKKNTESLGSIFDAQPSDLTGNIHCTTDPAEIVIGYIDISEEKTKRIFIRSDEVPGWGYATRCAQVIIDNQPDSILRHGLNMWPTIPFALDGFGGVLQYYATAELSCVDCTVDGTNVKPSFWP
ncbi:MAG: DUF4249 domain-containing protein [Ginsengibacter sp.]